MNLSLKLLIPQAAEIHSENSGRSAETGKNTSRSMFYRLNVKWYFVAFCLLFAAVPTLRAQYTYQHYYCVDPTHFACGDQGGLKLQFIQGSAPDGDYPFSTINQLGQISYGSIACAGGDCGGQLVIGSINAGSYPVGSTPLSTTVFVNGYSYYGGITIAIGECYEPGNGVCPGHNIDTIIEANIQPPTNTKCNDAKLGGTQQTCSGCSSPPGTAMAQYSIHAMLVSLNIQDTPLRYSPPRGPAIDFTVTYNERESQQPVTFNYSNLGPKWTFNWLSYITDDPTEQRSSTYVYVPGGGAEIYRFDSVSGTFLAEPQSHSLLIRTVQNTYEKTLPDGSKQFFNLSNGATTFPRRLFMTQMIDPAGNEVRIDYDNNFRITKIKALCVEGAACQQETTLEYNEPDPLKISKVTDPFGRFATFAYDGNGRLQTITDEIEIQSVFGYDGTTDTITSITTPYGATTFLRGVDGANRWIEATDPLGGKERVEYREQAQIDATEPSNLVPTGMTAANANLNLRNTFYWSKKANGVYDYANAKIIHWLLTPNNSTSGIVASEKMPLEYRVWYAYEGQSDLNHEGTNANPSQVARVLGDGTSQLYQYEHHNSFGKTTRTTDPLERQTTYVYDSNQIDLLEIWQKRASSDELLRKFEDYVVHKPRREFDTAGELTRYTYNSFGQLLTTTNARSEVTTYTYDRDDDNDGTTDGYLISIASPSGETSFGYDAFKRIRTVTNVEDQYTVTTDYDFLDRKTTVTYPDTTYEQFQYTDNITGAMTLDLTGSRDRLGRWTYRHYNRNRQMDTITDPANRTTSYGWCACGSLETITDPDGNGHVTTFHSDLQGRIYQKVFADSTTINYLFEGQTAPNTVGATSRLKSSTDALNRRTNYSYFVDDNISQVSYTDTSDNPLTPPTPSVNYTYDPYYNRVEKMNDGTGWTIYTYYQIEDPPGLGAGRLHTVDGPLGNDTITYIYDELGRIHEQSINGGANTETVEYDSVGRLWTTDNALGHFERGYDGVTPRLLTLTYPTGQTAHYMYFENDHDRRLQTIQNVNGGVNLSQFAYTYDAEGQIMSWSKLLDTTSSGLWFTHDNARQLRIAQNSSNPNTTTRQLEYGYDNAGNRTSDRNYNPQGSIGNGVSNSYGINVLNQVETRTRTDAGASSETQAFVYDAVGNLTSDGAGKSFEWDAANRLIAINYISSGNRTEFAYDGLGRRVKITEYGPGVTAEVEPTDGNYATFTSGKFTLPAGGYTITLQGLNPSGGDNTMLVDSVKLNNVLVSNGSFESPTVSDYQVAPSGPAWSFMGTAGVAANGGFYTMNNPPAPEGNQVAFIRKYGSISQSFNLSAATYKLDFKAAQRGSVNESSQRLRVTFRSSSAVISTKTFVWCGNTICEERDGTGANVTKRFFAEGEQRTEGIATANYFYTRDHLGSIREVTKWNGGLKAQYDYDPYGNRVVLSGQMDTDFGYTGHYFHAPSGLNLTLYRAYNPALGRWLSRDPIGEKGGLNLYGYVGNNPVNIVDPLGLQPYHGDLPPGNVPWNVPPGSVSQQVYGNATGGPFNSNLANTSNAFGNNVWSNCVRGCLFSAWNKCEQKYVPDFYTAHALCWAICTGSLLAGGI